MCVEHWCGVLAPACLSDVAISTDLNRPTESNLTLFIGGPTIKLLVAWTVIFGLLAQVGP